MARSADWWVKKAKEGLPRSVVEPHKNLSKKVPDQEAELRSNIIKDQIGGPVPITYEPTSSSNPQDPRTSAAGYDPYTKTLRIEWGDGGAAYNYYDVPPDVWKSFKRSKSPGKYINRVLNNYHYGIA